MKLKNVHLDFCYLEFYDHYMVCTVNEGETIDIEKSNRIAVEVDKFFFKKNYVYVTHRKFSYSVDPSIYKHTSMLENLLGFAVVSNNPISIASAKIEKSFVKNKSFKVFDTLEKAQKWVEELMALQGETET